MRQVALLIGISASITAVTAYTGTFESRPECEVVQDAVIVCVVNIGKSRYVTDIDIKRCREEASDMETQQ